MTDEILRHDDEILRVKSDDWDEDGRSYFYYVRTSTDDAGAKRQEIWRDDGAGNGDLIAVSNHRHPYDLCRIVSKLGAFVPRPR